MKTDITVICFKLEALKTLSNPTLQQVSIIYLCRKSVFSNSGIKAKDDVLCASILLKERERVFFGPFFLGFFNANLI